MIVLDPRLFSVRDKKGNPTPVWSLDTLRQAAAKWDKIVILERRSFKKDTTEQKLLSNLLLNIESLGEAPISNMEVLVCGDSVMTVTDDLKRIVLDSGARIKHVSNPREITYLNLDKFVLEGDHITWVRSWDQIQTLGLEPDKPKSFEDLQKARQKQSFWK